MTDTFLNDLTAFINDNPDINSTTKKNYLNTLKAIRGFHIENITENVDKIIEGLNNKYKNILSRKVNLINFTNVLVKSGMNLRHPEMYEILEKKGKELKTDVEKLIGENQGTEHQQDHIMEWDDIIDVWNKKKDTLDTMDRLLVAVYTMFMPQRVMEFMNMKIIYEMPETLPTEGDYVYINLSEKSGSFIFNTFKTAKKMGTQKNDISTELVNEIILSLEKQPRDYLFVNNENQPFKIVNSFNKWMLRKFQHIFDGKRIKSSLLRKSYITEHVDMTKTENEREEIAKIMKHSKNTQIGNYRIVKQKKEEPKKEEIKQENDDGDDIRNMIMDDIRNVVNTIMNGMTTKELYKFYRTLKP